MSDTAVGHESLHEESEAAGGKHLTFRLANEGYGIAIHHVQEIIGIMPVTHVPRSPAYLRGVINLRGKVIPVVDLRLKFGLKGQEDSAMTCIVVVQLTEAGKPITIGAIVDEVSEVLDIEPGQIEPAPAFGDRVEMSFIKSVAKVGGKVFMLIDAERALSGFQEEKAGVA